jgi:hypothetical protein
MSWSSRADNIGQRDWSDMVSAWSGIDRNFDTSVFLNDSLEDWVESNLQPNQIDGNALNIIQLENRTQLLSELVFTQVKANHAFLCALQRIDGGNATWGVTDAYHASMMLMRSILAALGIFICQIHGRNILVDVFPWMGRIDAQKKFKRANKDWSNSVCAISCKTKHIEQSDLFSIFQRLMNVSTVPPEIWPEAIIQNIVRIDKSHFSSARNKLIYGARFWFQPDDLLGECLSVSWSTTPQRDYKTHSFIKSDDASELDSYRDSWVMYKLSKAVHEEIYKSITDSIGIFSYIEARTEFSGLSTLNKQFASSSSAQELDRASRFDIRTIKNLSISSPVEIIDCDLRSFAWPGFLTSIDAPDASASGPTNGPACATTSARIAVHETCRPSTVKI